MYGKKFARNFSDFCTVEMRLISIRDEAEKECDFVKVVINTRETFVTFCGT